MTDKQRDEYELALKNVNREIINPENTAMLDKLMKDVATKIANQQIEPMDAYNYYLIKITKIFPNMAKAGLLSTRMDQLNTYLLLWILKLVGKHTLPEVIAEQIKINSSQPNKCVVKGCEKSAKWKYLTIELCKKHKDILSEVSFVKI